MSAPVDAKYLVANINGVLTNEVVWSSLKNHVDVPGVGGAGTSEEYDTATTGLTWDVAPVTVDSNTTYKSHLYVNHNTATEIYGVKSWSPSGAFDARCKMANGSTGAQNDTGLVIHNSGNTERLLVRTSQVGNELRIEAFTYAGSFIQRGVSWVAGGGDVYLRITRDGANNVSFYWSSDGYAWINIDTVAFTTTVAKLGFRCNCISAVDYYMLVDWLRTDV